ERHRGVLALFVTVVREHRAQRLVGGRVDALVVPVDCLQLFHQRDDRAMPLAHRVRQLVERLVISHVFGHGAVLRAAVPVVPTRLRLPGARSGQTATQPVAVPPDGASDDEDEEDAATLSTRIAMSSRGSGGPNATTSERMRSAISSARFGAQSPMSCASRSSPNSASGVWCASVAPSVYSTATSPGASGTI